MKELRTQINLMFHKRGFQVSFTVMLLFVVYSFINNYHRFTTDSIFNYDLEGMQAVHRSFLNESNQQHFQTFVFFFPFVSVLPFSF